MKNMSDFETREEIKQRMDALALRFAETHDEEDRAEIMELGCRLAEMKNLQERHLPQQEFFSDGPTPQVLISTEAVLYIAR